MRFCGYCGRPLAEGEVCSCTAQQQVQQPIQPPAYGGYTDTAAEPNNTGYQPEYTGYRQEAADEAPAAAGIEHDAAFDTNESTGYQQESVGYKDDDAGQAKAKGGSDKRFKLDQDVVEQKKDELFGKLTRTDVFNTYERGKKIVPDCIDANDGEIPIKQYDFAKLRTRISFEKAEGRLQVTNKRLLFRATGRSLLGRTELHEEFKVAEIAGIEIRNRYVLSLFKVITSLLLSAFFFFLGFIVPTWILSKADSDTLTAIFGVLSILWASFVFIASIAAGIVLRHIRFYNKFYWLRQIFVAHALGALFANVGFGLGFLFRAAIYGSNLRFDGIDPRVYLLFIIPLGILFLVQLFLMCFIPDLVVSIKTKGSLPAVFVAREASSPLNAVFGGRNNTNSGFKEVGPWKDTEKAIKELGTLIDDINTLGDAAIEKWRE